MTEHIEACQHPECGVCTRQNSYVVNNEQVHIVSYIDEYAVTTVVSPELGDPQIAMLQMMGVTQIPLFTIIVGYVGKDGSIGSSQTEVPDDQYMRFVERHSNLNEVGTMHEMVCDQVRANLIDLTTPVDIEEMEAESKRYLQDALDRLDRGELPPGLMGGGF